MQKRCVCTTLQQLLLLHVGSSLSPCRLQLCQRTLLAYQVI
jgi:hypothetical protein